MKTISVITPCYNEELNVRDCYDAIRKIFGRISATVHLHDAVKVGLVGDRGGWGVANVDFTDADRDGTEVTQTFRVLAAWVQEDAGWRIVLTQWSNAR